MFLPLTSSQYYPHTFVMMNGFEVSRRQLLLYTIRGAYLIRL